MHWIVALDLRCQPEGGVVGGTLEFGKTFCCRGSLEVFACLVRVRCVWYWPRDRQEREREMGGQIGR